MSNHTHLRVCFCKFPGTLISPIGRAIVHDNNLEQTRDLEQLAHNYPQSRLFIVDRDNYGKAGRVGLAFLQIIVGFSVFHHSSLLPGRFILARCGKAARESARIS